MENLSELKLELIGQIMQTDEIEALEKVSKELAFTSNAKPVLDFRNYASEPRKNVSLADILQEQKYEIGTYDEFQKAVAGIEWEQSLEELLSYLD